MLATDASNINICQYLQILSRGGLTVPSLSLKDLQVLKVDREKNNIKKKNIYIDSNKKL